VTEMTVIRHLAFVIAGLLFGSFVTVLVHRLPRRESVVSGRSMCPHCGVMIRARDNVPLVSYLLLRGRCRGCEASISVEYPLTEVATAALFLVASVAVEAVWVAAMIAPFLGVLLAAALIDRRHFIIPNHLVFPSLAAFGAAIVVLAASGQPVSISTALLGALAYSGGLFVLHVISPRGMGFGDVKFALLLGLVLGALGWAYVAVAAAGAVLSAGLVGVAVLLRGGTGKSKLPFGVFMALGALVAVAFAAPVASWYVGLAR
jgi:leader peptidase (prepilin peptidase)/N-methyltransferase